VLIECRFPPGQLRYFESFITLEKPKKKSKKVSK